MLNILLKSIFKPVALVAASGILLSGCASNSIESTPEYTSPPAALKEKMKSVMPNYEPWVAEVEKKFSTIGESISQADLEWADRLGIQNTNNIRIVKTEYFPMPQDGELLKDLELLGWGSPYEDARNMGYTIFIRPDRDTPKTRAEQLALIYIMENMGRSRFLYRSLVEQRMASEDDRPIMLEAKKLAKCAPLKNGKSTYSCKFTGTKPANQKAMEEAKKEQDKAIEQRKNDLETIKKNNLLEQEILEDTQQEIITPVVTPPIQPIKDSNGRVLYVP